ncbi:MAG: 4Fe-4S binding protein [Spirochaetes bacterium]|nr:4Fe-4S binding protein [Spirochaetota bacterium]
MAVKLAPVQIIRRITLGIMLVGLTTLTILHQKLQGIPSIDALDPFGGLETLLKFVSGGELIKKIEPGTLILFGGIVALGIVLSRFFCGWFCAFGALQGVFGWLGKKIFGRRLTVPPKVDRVLRWVKYPLLAAIIWFTWKAGELVIRPYDPLAAFGHLSAGLTAVWAEFAVGLVMLIAILLMSMLYERVFCKYLCPLGAVNAILGRIPLFRIKRVESTCISCAGCDRACPMNIDVSHAGTIDSPECISCMECVTACPTKKNSLVAALGGKAVRIGVIVALGFGIYFAAAAIGQAAGMLRFVAPTLQDRAAAGILGIEDIKGSSTYAMVAESFGIDLERLYREVGIDMKTVPPETMLKDTGKLAGIDGFEADAVRSAVARILGIPYAGEKGDLAPASPEGETPPAADTTKPAAAVPAPAVPAAAQKAKPAAASPGAGALVVPVDFELEGTMSINDIALALSTSTAAVIAKLGLPPDIAVDKPLRDMKDQYGYTMPLLKERIKK